MGKYVKEFIRDQSQCPNCCDMTMKYFREMLIAEARQKGFEVVRWPCRNREAFMAVGEAARTGEMKPGAAAVLCHSWSNSKYERECVPAWDFYPVINELMSKHELIYPHPTLDQLHSEKRYTSSLMAPTRYIHLQRSAKGWKVKGHGDKRVGQVVDEEMKKLKTQAAAKGLAFDDVMVKQGLSWAGEAVSRQSYNKVKDFVVQKMLPNFPEQAQKITVLLQAKLEIVSELRWCMVNGELRSSQWKSLNEPKRGQLAADADYQDQYEARKLVAKFCKQSMNTTVDELEESMSHLCKKVYEEAVADAGGDRPLYLRVDLLLDKQGRVWLGERESWGADLNGNDEQFKMNPTYKELAVKMLTKAKEGLRKLRIKGRFAKLASRKALKPGSRSKLSKVPVKKTIAKRTLPVKLNSGLLKRADLRRVRVNGGA